MQSYVQTVAFTPDRLDAMMDETAVCAPLVYVVASDGADTDGPVLAD